MDKALAWFKGRRVFPRWKLLAMVFSGVLIGWMVPLGEVVHHVLHIPWTGAINIMG